MQCVAESLTSKDAGLCFFFSPSEVLDSTASIQQNIAEYYNLKDKFSSPFLKDTLMWKASTENT